MKEGYYFTSTAFQIEAGEDDETNPRRYGKQLAFWLKGELEAEGCSVVDVFSEDWGWCVMCQWKPFMLWVGCGNQTDYHTAKPGDPPPAHDHVVWHCFPHAEVPFLKRIFCPNDVEPAVTKLDVTLKNILERATSIQLVRE